MKIGAFVPLFFCLVFALPGCIPKRVTEEHLVAERYGDVGGFQAVRSSQTLELKKTWRITLPGGWRYDPEVEARTLFNVKAVMFAWTDGAGTYIPPVFLEYKEGARGNFPTQEELANLSPADMQDLKAAFMTSTQAHLRVESVEIVSFNGLRGIIVKSLADGDRRPTQMYYSLKVPTGDILGSFLFAYFERQDDPYLEKEMRGIFSSVQSAKPAKPPRRRAAAQPQTGSQTVPVQSATTTQGTVSAQPSAPAQNGAPARNTTPPQSGATQSTPQGATAAPGDIVTQGGPSSRNDTPAQNTEATPPPVPAQNKTPGKLEISGQRIVPAKE